MILIIIGICILLMIIGVFINNVSYGDLGESIGSSMAVMGGIGIFVAIIASIFMVSTVSKQSIIDDQIAMYIEENSTIEQQISVIVDEYKKYERDTLSNLKPESMILLTTTYPELKTNDLVNAQLAIHIENNEKIKTLKEEKLSADVCRWWLYFGGRSE